MENYFALLILVVPGFIARDIYQKLNYDHKITNSFESTISALIYNIFIGLLNYIVIVVISSLLGIQFSEIKISVENSPFFILYILLTLVDCCIVAIIWDNIHPKYTYKFINWRRAKKSKNKLLPVPVWSASFNDGNPHLISIEREGCGKQVGLLERFTENNGELKDAYIVQEELAQTIIEKKSLRVKGTYFTNGLNITEYDIDNFLT
ncbi:MAG: hypothetical protein ABFC57_12875 [Veillonellales bacterium]